MKVFENDPDFMNSWAGKQNGIIKSCLECIDYQKKKEEKRSRGFLGWEKWHQIITSQSYWTPSKKNLHWIVLTSSDTWKISHVSCNARDSYQTQENDTVHNKGDRGYCGSSWAFDDQRWGSNRTRNHSEGSSHGKVVLRSRFSGDRHELEQRFMNQSSLSKMRITTDKLQLVLDRWVDSGNWDWRECQWHRSRRRSSFDHH